MFGEACWLGSSNIANEPFYNSHGFYTVGEAIIGNDDPNWHEAPVIVQIVSISRQSHHQAKTDAFVP
jgi:hypothetical protein